MKEFLIKVFIVFLALIVPFSSCFAKTNMKMRADVNEEFSIKYQDLPDEITFTKTKEKVTQA